MYSKFPFECIFFDKANVIFCFSWQEIQCVSDNLIIIQTALVIFGIALVSRKEVKILDEVYSY